MRIKTMVVLLAAPILMTSCVRPPLPDTKQEKAAVTQVIKNSIGWAEEKDFDLLYSCFGQDAEFFIYHPDAESTIRGFEAFRDHAERVFGNDKFKATGFRVKNLQINFSRGGDIAWYNCLLDDFGEWDGEPFGWENCRWTGVLEKREGKWVIVQMHFSFPQ